MSPARILLADDHAVVRAGIRKTIEEIPDVTVAAEADDGPQVFQALKEKPIDCLLIDVAMPDFNPIHAIIEIKALYPALKILVVSAYDDEVYVQGLIGAGVNGYHLKDQPLSDLKLAVQRVLTGERWITSVLIDKLVSAPQTPSNLPTLTIRQRMLLRALQQGLDNQTIAREIGLSIKTVENHLTRLYRHLGVQSRLEAATFVARFPQVLGLPGQEAAQGEATPPAEHQQFLAILLVDDNMRYRSQLQRMIGRLSPRATIYEAEDIQSAVRIAQQVDLQLALVDVVLGDVDGITCVRRIKAIRPKARIILISAYPDREFHRQGLQSGAIAFLDKKDLDMATLRHVIDDMTL
jgi:DNA-binding NarL/FixJ family response regulator